MKAGGASRFQKGEQVLNRGVVLACDPPRKLRSLKPVMGNRGGKAVARHLRDRSARRRPDKLTIIHDDFQDGSKAAGYVGEGWMRVAASLKDFVETGKGMDLLGA